MLIVAAEVDGNAPLDVRIERGRIAAMHPRLEPRADEAVLEARGGALLPGLHDHHLHLLSLVAADSSCRCGPPQVRNEAELAAALLEAEGSHAMGWIRGVGYHESVAGPLDRHRLDALAPPHPLRIQHRSGALWMLNSLALDELGLDLGVDASGVERDTRGRATGRLFRLDAWLGQQLEAKELETKGSRSRPSLACVSRRLAALGVTGLTDATASNSANEMALFRDAADRGELLQRLIVMGSADLPATPHERVERGALKIVLHEGALPAFDLLRDRVRAAHDQGRAVAVHCVTRTELVFASEVLAAAGRGAQTDRIEHAAIAPPESVKILREIGVCVVTQPNFVRERGDAYLTDVAAHDLPWLYRCGQLAEAGVAIGGGTDAPFGDPNPWLAMQAAVQRRTSAGVCLGPGERVSPEAALGLFTSPPEAPGAAPRRVAPGAAADLCLLDRSWSRARNDLAGEHVAATIRGGEIIYASEGVAVL